MFSQVAYPLINLPYKAGFPFLVEARHMVSHYLQKAVCLRDRL